MLILNYQAIVCKFWHLLIPNQTTIPKHLFLTFPDIPLEISLSYV